MHVSRQKKKIKSIAGEIFYQHDIKKTTVAGDLLKKRVKRFNEYRVFPGQIIERDLSTMEKCLLFQFKCSEKQSTLQTLKIIHGNIMSCGIQPIYNPRKFPICLNIINSSYKRYFILLRIIIKYYISHEVLDVSNYKQYKIPLLKLM